MESIRIPVDPEVVAELSRRLRGPDESFNDLLRAWLGLPPRRRQAMESHAHAESNGRTLKGMKDSVDNPSEVDMESTESSESRLTPTGRRPRGGVPLPEGTALRARIRGREVEGQVRDGWVEIAGRRFASLSAAARHLAGHPANGWRVFQVRPPGATAWVRAEQLRRAASLSPAQ